MVIYALFVAAPPVIKTLWTTLIPENRALKLSDNRSGQLYRAHFFPAEDLCHLCRQWYNCVMKQFKVSMKSAWRGITYTSPSILLEKAE